MTTYVDYSIELTLQEPDQFVATIGKHTVRVRQCRWVPGSDGIKILGSVVEDVHTGRDYDGYANLHVLPLNIVALIHSAEAPFRQAKVLEDLKLYLAGRDNCDVDKADVDDEIKRLEAAS